MKKITLLFISCIALCLSLTAQNNTFLKSYSSGSSVLWQYAEPNPTGYTYVGILGSNLVWAQADTSGNIITCKKYTSSLGFPPPPQIENIPINPAIVYSSLPGNAILVTCPYKNGLRLLKINSNGGVAWSTYYKLSGFNALELKNTTLTNNKKSIWLYGDGHKGNIKTAYLINVDSAGSVKQSKTVVIDTSAKAPYGIGGLNDFGGIAQGNDNSYYIGLDWFKPQLGPT